jgi:hypothetical protein
MLMFPRFVFKNGGPHQRQGGFYNQELVASEVEFNAALEAGWFATLPEAIAPVVTVVPVISPEAHEPDADEGAPTRAELEAKAKELGIEFGARIGDKKLLERITEALKAKES